MQFTSAFLASALFLSLASAACSVHLGDDTGGENGIVRFEYSTCLFGCSLDRNALQGSKVSILAKGADPDLAVTARMTDGAIGSVSSQSQSCSCASSSGSSAPSRSVTPGEKCAKTETKSCSLSVDIETKGAGDAKLEVVDRAGNVVDRVTVHVRPAARIEVTVKDRSAGADGVYAVGRGEKLKIASKVLDADDREMIFAQHGVRQQYADDSIVGPDDTVIIGTADVEDAVAKRTGETSLAIRAIGAESTVRFRVK